jgi:hypothetical protein
LRTLHPVPSLAPDPIRLGLVREDTIDFIFSTFSLPAERVAGYAQVVLSFVTEGAAPKGLAGMSVASSAAAFVAYEFGANWSIDVDRSDASGMVLLGNLPASQFPGTEVRATLTLNGMAKGFVPLQVAADAVTIVEVPILP